MSDLKMPERLPEDGAAGVSRLGKSFITIEVTTDGKIGAVTMSEHNAWRIFGMLALILGIPLAAKVGKAIRF